MKGYWLILAGTAIDTEAQATYGQLWKPIAEKYKAKIHPLNAQDVLVETRGYTRALVVEFESYDAAVACYKDNAYQAAKVFALRAAQRELLILQGDPPQS